MTEQTMDIQVLEQKKLYEIEFLNHQSEHEYSQVEYFYGTYTDAITWANGRLFEWWGTTYGEAIWEDGYWQCWDEDGSRYVNIEAIREVTELTVYTHERGLWRIDLTKTSVENKDYLKRL